MNRSALERIDRLIQRIESLETLFEGFKEKSVSKSETVYRQTLIETVEVLVKTKGAFQSKTLKNLREKIEQILREE